MVAALSAGRCRAPSCAGSGSRRIDGRKSIAQPPDLRIDGVRECLPNVVALVVMLSLRFDLNAPSVVCDDSCAEFPATALSDVHATDAQRRKPSWMVASWRHGGLAYPRISLVDQAYRFGEECRTAGQLTERNAKFPMLHPGGSRRYPQTLPSGDCFSVGLVCATLLGEIHNCVCTSEEPALKMEPCGESSPAMSIAME